MRLAVLSGILSVAAEPPEPVNREDERAIRGKGNERTDCLVDGSCEQHRPSCQRAGPS